MFRGVSLNISRVWNPTVLCLLLADTQCERPRSNKSIDDGHSERAGAVGGDVLMA